MNAKQHEHEVTADILHAITDKGEYVLHVKPHLTGGVKQYFFYRSNSGPQYGWWLFREEEDGDETALCDVSTKRQLCLAVELFDICSPETLFPHSGYPCGKQSFRKLLEEI